MKSDSTIVGLSLAELSFTITLVLIAVVLTNIDLLPQQPTVDQETFRQLTAKLEQEQKLNHDLMDKMRQLSTKLGNKLSNIPAACAGKALLDLTIVDEDLFEVAGKRMTSREIFYTYRDAIQRARAVPCVYVVHAKVSANTRADTFVSASRRLERYFYVRGFSGD